MTRAPNSGGGIVTACVLTLLCGSAQPAEGYRIEVLVAPGPFHGVHGLALGPDKALYAGDIVGMSVHRIDPVDGSRRIAVGPPVGMADDVAFAPAGTPFAGTMVWSGVFTGRVYARAPDGRIRLVADGWAGVNTVAFSPDGNLYATQLGPFANALWRVDLSGAGKHVKILGTEGAFNSFVITGDNVLYGPRADIGAIVQLDLQTLQSTTIADGFRWPTAAKLDSTGVLRVVDFEAGTVWRVDPRRREKTLLATLEPGLDNLTIDSADRIYVSSITRNGIFEINPSTGRVSPLVQGQLIAPGGLAVLDGVVPRVFIADMFVLREVDGTTGAVRNLTRPGKTGPYPTAVQVFRENGAARVMYTSWFTGDLTVIDPDTGEVLRHEKGLASPHDAVRLDDGTIFVAESGAGRIMRLAVDGQRRPIGPVFKIPIGLASDRSGRLFVTDATSGTLTALDPLSGQTTLIADGLGRPEGVGVSPRGGVLVVDSAKREILCIDPTNGLTQLISGAIEFGLEGSEPLLRTWVHNGIAVTDNGIVYFPSDTNAALYRLVPVVTGDATEPGGC